MVVWIAFLVFVFLLLALDLGVFHRKAHVVSVREALTWTCVWVTLALAFSGFVYFAYDNQWLGLGVAPRQHEPVPQRGEHTDPLGCGRLRRDERHRPLACLEPRRTLRRGQQVAAEPGGEQADADGIHLLVQLRDGATGQLGRARSPPARSRGSRSPR